MPSTTPSKEKTIKNLTPLHAKKQEQATHDARLHLALRHARQAERAADTGRTKRKDSEFLARYLALPLHSSWAIRPAEDYRAKSHNLSRQVLSLIDHLYIRYPVPLFLYRFMLSQEGLGMAFGNEARKSKPQQEAVYRGWFLAVAQGRSFAKLTTGFFTKREAHWFLQAPDANTIEQNVLWARAVAAEVPREGCAYLVDRLDVTDLKRIGDRLPDLLRFYADAWPQMRGYDVDEITDFIRAAVHDKAFSFKGRTYGSMRKLSHEWHRTTYSVSMRRYQSWATTIPHWEHREDKLVARAWELTNNRALAEEGQKQHHCLYAYTHRCLQGRSRIVTLRQFAHDTEKSRITLEIHPAQREVVQIRGKMNRHATEDEMRLILLWAGDQGLTVGRYA